jgi:hypothetical protein
MARGSYEYEAPRMSGWARFFLAITFIVASLAIGFSLKSYVRTEKAPCMAPNDENGDGTHDPADCLVAPVLPPGDVTLLETTTNTDARLIFATSYANKALTTNPMIDGSATASTVTIGSVATPVVYVSAGATTATRAVGVGTTSPHASAILHLSSTTKGALFPVMTTAQKNAISSPTKGLVVIDSDLSKICFYNGSVWQTVTSA